MKYFSTLVCLLLMASTSFAGVRVATYNIRNFDSTKSPTDKKALKKILKDLNADLITVEEIVNTNSFRKFIKSELPEYGVTLSHCGGGGRQKIGFVYNKSKFTLLSVKEDSRVTNPTKSISYLKIACGGLRPALIGIFSEIKSKDKFAVVGLHLKAGSGRKNFERRWKQYKIVATIVSELKRKYKNVMVMGDLNTTGYSILDADYDKFQELLTDVKMDTVATEMLCTSYWSGTNRQDNIEESSILDHIVYPSNFLGYKVDQVEVHSHCKRLKCSRVSPTELGNSYQNVSDHCPVSISFK